MIYRKKRIQSENLITIKLCHMLLLNNIEFDVEYDPDWGVKQKRKNGQRGARFDLIIIRDDRILAIVECKKSSTALAIKQTARYAKYGPPVLLCNGLEKIDDVLERCKELYLSPPDSEPAPCHLI